MHRTTGWCVSKEVNTMCKCVQAYTNSTRTCKLNTNKDPECTLVMEPRTFCLWGDNVTHHRLWVLWSSIGKIDDSGSHHYQIVSVGPLSKVVIPRLLWQYMVTLLLIKYTFLFHYFVMWSDTRVHLSWTLETTNCVAAKCYGKTSRSPETSKSLHQRAQIQNTD